MCLPDECHPRLVILSQDTSGRVETGHGPCDSRERVTIGRNNLSFGLRDRGGGLVFTAFG